MYNLINVYYVYMYWLFDVLVFRIRLILIKLKIVYIVLFSLTITPEDCLPLPICFFRPQLCPKERFAPTVVQLFCPKCPMPQGNFCPSSAPTMFSFPKLCFKSFLPRLCPECAPTVFALTMPQGAPSHRCK